MAGYVHLVVAGRFPRGGTAPRRRGDTVINMPLTRLNQLQTQIGFIGLGLMGSRLVRRLDSFGWQIRAWNRSPQPAEAMSEWGIPTASSIADLVADSDVIISSLANDSAVRSVYLDNGGVFSSNEPGTVILGVERLSPGLSRGRHREAR